MTLQLSTLAHSLTQLEVMGLVIKDIHEIPAEVGTRTPMLIPAPDFMTEFSMERNSFGGGSSAKMTVTYTLNWVLCYVQAGAGRALEYYDDMIDLTTRYLDAVLAIDVINGSIDVVPISVTGMGIVTDPAGVEFIGCRISLRCQEFVN